MRALNLAVKFGLEIAALVGFAVWGWQAGGLVLAAVAPVAGVVAWGLLAAPKASRRLPSRWRIPFELGFFALAALAWWAGGHPTTAAVFAVVAAANAIALTAWNQWEH